MQAGDANGQCQTQNQRRRQMGTVSKALVLLGVFTRQRPLVGLSDFARLSGMNKATCHRMLTELTEFG
ncbi:MAG: helix-turn-helix domain-containing protein, partial [Paracoccaceae bacterium]|nr:helix-turn-helix domain-containing protein [Paracoccaceae bacterium]